MIQGTVDQVTNIWSIGLLFHMAYSIDTSLKNFNLLTQFYVYEP